MNKKLAGAIFVRNGIQYDYCFMESINSLLQFCDRVFVVDAGSDDGTLEKIESISSLKLEIIARPKEEWEEQNGTGQAKLCYFTDIAIQAAQEAGYEYVYYQQADEITHEKSYDEIRKAIATGSEGFLIQRINLWGDPYHQLDVPQERKPCSTAIVRLAKTVYRSYGDAESLAVPLADSYFYNGIRMWHYGFVRKKEVMKDKIINMQCNVFEMADYDVKLNDCEVFDSTLWFNDSDLKIIETPHPKIMMEWIKTRP